MALAQAGLHPYLKFLSARAAVHRMIRHGSDVTTGAVLD